MAAKKKATKKAAKRAVKKPARKAAPRKASPIPKGYTALTSMLLFKDTRPALEWYQKAFGARVTTRMDMPDGRVMHAEMRIGDALFLLGDEAPERGYRSAETLGGSATALMHYTKDCDSVFARAVGAGAKVLMPLMDMFWGDRFGEIQDPFGHRWAIATHVKDLTPRQMGAAAEEAVKKMAAGQPPTA